MSVLPIEVTKIIMSKNPIIELTDNSDVEKQALNWALEKLKTIQYETQLFILKTIKDESEMLYLMY